MGMATFLGMFHPAEDSDRSMFVGTCAKINVHAVTCRNEACIAAQDDVAWIRILHVMDSWITW